MKLDFSRLAEIAQTAIDNGWSSITVTKVHGLNCQCPEHQLREVYELQESFRRNLAAILETEIKKSCKGEA